jgi:DNA mismatch repair ATPase MutS
MSQQAAHIYRSRIQRCEREIAQIKNRNNWYSLIRLLSFAGAIFLLIKLVSVNIYLAIGTALAAISILLLFVNRSSRLSARKKLLEELLEINKSELNVLRWDFDNFDPGRPYIDPDHPYSSDLDIFGERSLFQYLNRTSIAKGRECLAGWLSLPAEPSLIPERQEAVRELSIKLDWRQEFYASGRLSKETEQDYSDLINWLATRTMIMDNRAYKILLILLPLLSISSLALSFWLMPWNIPVTFILLQLGIVGWNLRRINHHHNQVSRKFDLLVKYAELIRLVEGEDFESAHLNALQEELRSDGKSARQKLRSLARIVIDFDRRLNMIVGIVLNGLLMWDLQCILRLERWKRSSARELPGWFAVLGEFEALNSLAGYRFNVPGTVFPTPVPDGPIIQAASLGHPLIHPDENIPNDIRIDHFGQFMLITGSNMAGKSTFLRTVGVSLVLAAAGAPVMARKMLFRPVAIFTSMRIRDSLSSRESTFYAELKRLRRIIDIHNQGQHALVLLDEILKGTNSRDKHFGSEMFIRQLIELNSAGLIATHDLELSKLETEFPDHLRNYCFEVQIDRQEFIYDYKLRSGVCQTMNATELMKKMGISIEIKTR